MFDRRSCALKLSGLDDYSETLGRESAMRLQQQSRLKNIALALGAAMTFAVAGSGFAQQQTSRAPASNQAVGPVSATVIGVAAIAVAIAVVTANEPGSTPTGGTTGTK